MPNLYPIRRVVALQEMFDGQTRRRPGDVFHYSGPVTKTGPLALADDTGNPLQGTEAHDPEEGEEVNQDEFSDEDQPSGATDAADAPQQQGETPSGVVRRKKAGATKAPRRKAGRGQPRR